MRVGFINEVYEDPFSQMSLTHVRFEEELNLDPAFFLKYWKTELALGLDENLYSFSIFLVILWWALLLTGVIPFKQMTLYFIYF